MYDIKEEARILCDAVGVTSELNKEIVRMSIERYFSMGAVMSIDAHNKDKSNVSGCGVTGE